MRTFGIKGTEVVRHAPGRAHRQRDELCAEEHIIFYVDGEYLGRTVHTPGHEVDLAYGYALVEGVIRTAGDVAGVELSSLDGTMKRANILLSPDRAAYWEGVKRCEPWHGTVIPGLGNVRGLRRPSWALSSGTMHEFMQAMEAAQVIFPRTGGAHCAALFSATGERLAQAEDIGRHNALDKVIGMVLRANQQAAVGVMSSRLSWELVRKASAAGLEILAGISAATSLAVETAERCGITLVGRLRGGCMTVYTHPDRLRPDAGSAAPVSCRDESALVSAATR